MSARVVELLAERAVIPHLHQREGMDWCAEREEAGGILGDPMGLGKTLLSLMVILRNPRNRTLIVVPLPLLEQWVSAVQKILGHEPCVFHSSRGTTKADKGWLESKEAHVFITTYGLLTRKGVLHEIAWDRVMYDEAHTLRNSATKGFKAAASLQSGSQFFITGTPIQNQTADIESLLSLLHEPITKTDADLKDQIGKCMLRRTKESVGMTLPPLYTTDIEVPWASLEEQRRATGIHASLSFSNVELGKEDSKPYKKMGEYNRLALMTRAKQACTNSDLLLPFIKELNQQTQHSVPTSSKFTALIAKVQERLPNKKNKVIFSSFRGELDNIVQALRTPDIRVAAIDGRTPAAERQLILHDTYDVLVMQINTGSVGLNLQQYSEVYFVGPGWNPATEQQAIARCHRQGQTEPVHVFRFVMSGFTEADLKQKQKMEEEAAQEAAAAAARDAMLATLTPDERATLEAAEQEAEEALPPSKKPKLAPTDWRSSTIDMYARAKQRAKLDIAQEFVDRVVE
jgi:SNF2 family DNA or RNA helicase